jgi:hypothetical protein
MREKKKPESRCSSIDTTDYGSGLILERNIMLRKKSNELKNNVERKSTNRLIKEKSVLAETKKEAAIPMSFAGFPTCFNFLRIPAAEEKTPSKFAT